MKRSFLMLVTLCSVLMIGQPLFAQQDLVQELKVRWDRVTTYRHGLDSKSLAERTCAAVAMFDDITRISDGMQFLLKANVKLVEVAPDFNQNAVKRLVDKVRKQYIAGLLANLDKPAQGVCPAEPGTGCSYTVDLGKKGDVLDEIFRSWYELERITDEAIGLKPGTMKALEPKEFEDNRKAVFRLLLTQRVR